ILPPVAPPPAMEPTVSLKLLRSSTAPATSAKLTALLSEITPAAPNCIVPALIVVAPVYVLAPDKVNTPLPAFVKLPVSLMTPENVVELASPPAVNVPDPNNTLPLPANDPIVSEISFKSNVPLAPTVIAVESASLPEPLNCNVPALIVVVPM